MSESERKKERETERVREGQEDNILILLYYSDEGKA